MPSCYQRVVQKLSLFGTSHLEQTPLSSDFSHFDVFLQFKSTLTLKGSDKFTQQKFKPLEFKEFLLLPQMVQDITLINLTRVNYDGGLFMIKPQLLFPLFKCSERDKFLTRGTFCESVQFSK